MADVLFIDVEAAKEFAEKHYYPCIEGYVDVKVIKNFLEECPTVDEELLTEKLTVHAHWEPKEIFSKYFTDQFECSNCHCISINHLIIPKDEFEAEYCPHCGAQMDEVVE